MRNDWIEKYRPTKIEECVLRESIYQKAERIIKTGKIQNLLLKGKAGTGKTSFAEALSNQLNFDAAWWSSRTMDEMRKNLNNTGYFTYNLYGQERIVILDEFDHSTSDVQKMILKPMEGYQNCFVGWILIVNDASKLGETIISRVCELDFDIPDNEAEEMKDQFMRRCESILEKEEINYTEEVLRKYIEKYFPGYRKILNEIQGGVDLNNKLLPI